MKRYERLAKKEKGEKKTQKKGKEIRGSLNSKKLE